MKQTAILLYPSFSEYELSVAMSVLAQGEKPMVTVGDAPGPVQGEAGLLCTIMAAYEDVDPEDFDSLVMPGMMTLLSPGEEARCLSFLQAMEASGCILAAISLAPYLLAKAGLLQGRPYTIGMYEEDMDQMGVFDKTMLLKDLVVEDGNLITAVGAGFVSFGLALGRALELSFDATWYG